MNSDFIAELVEFGFGDDELLSRLSEEELRLYQSLKREKTMTTAKKAVAKKVATKNTVEKRATVRVGRTKTSIALEIFNEHFNKLPRKDILIMFQEQAKLTKSGSSTFYQNFKKKHESKEV